MNFENIEKIYVRIAKVYNSRLKSKRSIFRYGGVLVKILVADSDQNVCKTLKRVLERSNYTVDAAYDADDVTALTDNVSYDVIILDEVMPGKEDLEVLKELRRKKIVNPILLISAKTEVEDKVRGLDAGADDYLSKPFAISELSARVRAMLRRSSSYTATDLTIGNLKLDCSGYVLSTEYGSYNMNNKEFQMIEYFMRNPGKIYSTEDLMAHFWGWESDSAINVVWTNIANIRRKLKKMKANVKITSIRGVGYKLEEM